RPAPIGKLGDHPLWPSPEARLDLHLRDLDARRLLLVRDQLAQRTQVAEVVVAEWQIEERFSWGGDPQPPERPHTACQLGQDRADGQVEVARGEGHWDAPPR